MAGRTLRRLRFICCRWRVQSFDVDCGVVGLPRGRGLLDIFQHVFVVSAFAKNGRYTLALLNWNEISRRVDNMYQIFWILSIFETF